LQKICKFCLSWRIFYIIFLNTRRDYKIFAQFFWFFFSNTSWLFCADFSQFSRAVFLPRFLTNFLKNVRKKCIVASRRARNCFNSWIIRLARASFSFQLISSVKSNGQSYTKLSSAQSIAALVNIQPGHADPLIRSGKVFFFSSARERDRNST